MDRFFLLFIVVLLSGCIRGDSGVTATNPPSSPQIARTSPAGTLSYFWSDASPLMNGVCFEAALHHAGQVFVVRDAGQHIQFYDQIDTTHLCRRPVTRHPFDFSNGHVLAGLWSAGRGCTAWHDVMGMVQDDRAKQIVIQLKFISEGLCNYELVRPFWINVEGVNSYMIDIVVSQ
jgi:hypothetical protein